MQRWLDENAYTSGWECFSAKSKMKLGDPILINVGNRAIDHCTQHLAKGLRLLGKYVGTQSSQSGSVRLFASEESRVLIASHMSGRDKLIILVLRTEGFILPWARCGGRSSPERFGDRAAAALLGIGLSSRWCAISNGKSTMRECSWNECLNWLGLVIKLLLSLSLRLMSSPCGNLYYFVATMPVSFSRALHGSKVTSSSSIIH